MSNVEELRTKFQEFQIACKTILPKVDPVFVEDVILREQQNPQEQPMYTIEVFSDGINPEDEKGYTSRHRNDAIHTSSLTHYVINHKISLETLERIQKYTDVQEIKGEFSVVPLQVEWTNVENAMTADWGGMLLHEEHFKPLGLIV